MQTSLLQIGIIAKPHALRGQLRVRLHNPASCALDTVSKVWLVHRQAVPTTPIETGKAWDVEAVQMLPDSCYIVSLAGVADRTAAEALQGAQVYVRREELLALTENEVYLADLEGLLVRTASGDEIGRVSRVLDLNGNVLLCVARADKPEVLLPAIPQVLMNVDLTAGFLVVNPPDGLLSD